MKRIFCPAFAFLLLVGCVQTDSIPAPNNEKATVAPDGDGNGSHSPQMPISIPTDETTKDELSPGIPISIPTEDADKTEMKETWIPLFDGKTLNDWTVPVYGGDGMVDVDEENITIGRGEMMTGIRYDKEFPKIDYEIRYEAKRTEGYDFFGACTFPVNESFCTFVNGGWGGGLTGLSSINGYDASENSTSTFCEYKSNTWYRFRIRVTDEKLQVWLTGQDKEGNWGTEQSVIELEREGRSLSIRFEMDRYKPLGFCTWCAGAQLRNIEYRKLDK